jgi:hypothetical protein
MRRNVLPRIKQYIASNPQLQARLKLKKQGGRKHHSGIISPSATYHLMMYTLHKGYLQQYMHHKNGAKMMRTALAMLFGLYEGMCASDQVPCAMLHSALFTPK